MTVLFFIFTFVIAIILVGAFKSKDTIKNAYLQGRRDALKDAVHMAKDKADVAVYMSPEGDLQLGMTRAQVAFSIEMELRQMMNREV